MLFHGTEATRAEFRRCLVEIDAPAARRLWRDIAPKMPQPASDDEALHTIHLTRLQLPGLDQRAVAYSRAWLAERNKPRLAHAVGIAVSAPPERRQRALEVREAMSGAVMDAIKDGVDIATETAEIRRRMAEAKARA
jgi:hypothetical protein